MKTFTIAGHPGSHSGGGSPGMSSDPFASPALETLRSAPVRSLPTQRRREVTAPVFDESQFDRF